jgi:hypothetical protein
MLKLLNLRHPFFRPVWRRAVTTGLCFGWALVELGGNNVFWAMLFGGIGAICLYEFFIDYDPAHYADPADKAQTPAPTDDDAP